MTTKIVINMCLVELEKEYSRNLKSQYSELVKLYNKISLKQISLDKRDITYAILYRMKTYYEMQNDIKNFLNKRYISAASDFFVETIAFYLKLIIGIKKENLEVHSERQIKPKRGFIRPDISIWKDNQVITIIECKTQLGWNRVKWEEDFYKREMKLKETYPKAKAYLLVMTAENWSGIPKDNKYFGRKYFTISKTRPSNIDFRDIDKAVINPIEDLFLRVLS